MARIAIIGAGNLGSFLAAHLAFAGHSVFLCVRRPVTSIAVHGLAPVTVPFYLENPPPADLILLTVKAYDTPSTMGWLQELCHEGQPVAVIQNGVHHAERVAPFPAIPVLSYVYVEAQNGPFHPFDPPRALFPVPAEPLSHLFVTLFADTQIQVHQEPAFAT